MQSVRTAKLPGKSPAPHERKHSTQHTWASWCTPSAQKNPQPRLMIAPTQDAERRVTRSGSKESVLWNRPPGHGGQPSTGYAARFSPWVSATVNRYPRSAMSIMYVRCKSVHWRFHLVARVPGLVRIARTAHLGHAIPAIGSSTFSFDPCRQDQECTPSASAGYPRSTRRHPIPRERPGRNRTPRLDRSAPMKRRR